MDFPTEISVEYQRLSDAAEQARLEWLGTDEAEARLNCFVRYQNALAAIEATPEQAFLNDVKVDEIAATCAFLDGEVDKRGRQTALLFLESREGIAVDTIICNGQPGIAVFPTQSTGNRILTVAADMSKLTAAQVAASLRMLADYVAKNPIPIYGGVHPLSGGQWITEEWITGEKRHITVTPSDTDVGKS